MQTKTMWKFMPHWIIAVAMLLTACGGEVPIEPLPTAPPPAPTGVTGTAGDASIIVDWTTVAGATGYNVYIAEETGILPGNWLLKLGGAKHGPVYPPFTVPTLTNGVIYYFVVTALNEIGESPPSIEKFATPVAGAVTAPTAPINVAAAPGTGTISISWDPVAGATGYDIYYAEEPAVTAANYATLVGGNLFAGATSPQSFTLATGVTYYFVVVATNAGGNSPESAEVSGAPL